MSHHSLWVPFGRPVRACLWRFRRGGTGHAPTTFLSFVLTATTGTQEYRNDIWSIEVPKQPSPLSYVQHMPVAEQLESRWQWDGIRERRRGNMQPASEPMDCLRHDPSRGELALSTPPPQRVIPIHPISSHAHPLSSAARTSTQTTSIEGRGPRPHLSAPHPPIRAWPNKLHVV